MKILLINNFHERKGGAEVVYLNTIELLRNRGHEVITLSRKTDQNDQTKTSEYFIDYSSSYVDKFYSQQAKKIVKEIVESEKPDIAHIHNIVGGITISILPVLKKYKVPIVATIHDYRLLCPTYIFIDKKNNICDKCKGGKYYYCTIKNCSPLGIKRSFTLSIESFFRDKFFSFQKYIDQFIFVSDFSMNKFLEVYPNLSNRSTRIYNFTNNFNKQLSSDNYFLSFGRLSAEKGILTLIKAFNQNLNLKLIIVGEGPLKIEAEKIISPNIELTGHKKGRELEELIAKSSFVIVPSEWFETNSLTTVEAYSYGKPVIGSKIGALPELIKDGETGFLFTPKDIKKLSSLIKVCSSMLESEYNKLSKSAYDYAINNFSSDVHYKQLMDVYESVSFQMNFTNRSSLDYD